MKKQKEIKKKIKSKYEVISVFSNKDLLNSFEIYFKCIKLQNPPPILKELFILFMYFHKIHRHIAYI